VYLIKVSKVKIWVKYCVIKVHFANPDTIATNSEIIKSNQKQPSRKSVWLQKARVKKEMKSKVVTKKWGNSGEFSVGS